jgi:transcription antitermination factor NusG
MAPSNKVSLPWFALQVKGHYENVVSVYLGGKGYEWLLPLYKIRSRWTDRWKEIKRPLFPGYVFCRFDPLDRLPILTIPGVSRIVGVAKRPVPIDETEIAAIQVAVKSGLPSQPWPLMQIGQRVRIERGPLCGLEGILAEFRGHHRLVLSITLLQRSIAVQVEHTWVMAIPQHSRSYTDPPSTLAEVR